MKVLELVGGGVHKVPLINKHADIKATGCRSNKTLMLSWLLSSSGLKALNELVSLAVLDRNTAVSTRSNQGKQPEANHYGEHGQPERSLKQLCL